MIGMGKSSDNGGRPASQIWPIFLAYNAVMASLAVFVAWVPFRSRSAGAFDMNADPALPFEPYLFAGDYALLVALTVPIWLVGAFVLGMALILAR